MSEQSHTSKRSFKSALRYYAGEAVRITTTAGVYIVYAIVRICMVAILAFVCLFLLLVMLITGSRRTAEAMEHIAGILKKYPI